MTRRLLLIAVLAITACGTPQPSSPLATSAGSGEGCVVTTNPGPADEPQRGPEFELADYGGGRWRLCLLEPMVSTAEYTAWCKWTPDRSAVIDVGGHLMKLGALDFDVGLALDRNELRFRTEDQDVGALSRYYVPGPTAPVVDATDDGRSGNLAFDVVLRVEPDGPPPFPSEPRYAGFFSWRCGDPPPRS